MTRPGCCCAGAFFTLSLHPAGTNLVVLVASASRNLDHTSSGRNRKPMRFGQTTRGRPRQVGQKVLPKKTGMEPKAARLTFMLVEMHFPVLGQRIMTMPIFSSARLPRRVPEKTTSRSGVSCYAARWRSSTESDRPQKNRRKWVLSSLIWIRAWRSRLCALLSRSVRSPDCPAQTCRDAAAKPAPRPRMRS